MWAVIKQEIMYDNFRQFSEHELVMAGEGWESTSVSVYGRGNVKVTYKRAK